MPRNWEHFGLNFLIVSGGKMRAILGLVIAVIAFSGCTKNSSSFRFIGDIDGIFSTRPQTATHSLLLIKMQNPPLLSAMVEKNGKSIVDDDLATSIQTEQDEAIAALAKISPDIKVLYRYRMVINAVAVVTPKALEEKIRQMTNVI